MINNIILGDCIEEMKKLPENSVDAIITDPPYDLTSQKVYSKSKKVEEIKGTGVLRKNIEQNTCYGSIVKGFMGKKWDGTGIAFNVETWKEALRVLKPGGFLLSFGGVRTHHRLMVAIEDAGFEIRDNILWIYSSGFPKSLNVGKQIRKIKKISDYDGWGTALKPAYEPIVLARKPISEKNIAINTLKWGTGGINIDDCRLEGKAKKWTKPKGGIFRPSINNDAILIENPKGRYPSNIILDEESTKILNEQRGKNKVCFFYVAKASKSEKNFGMDNVKEKFTSASEFRPNHMEKTLKGESGSPFGRFTPVKNNHPTVKPLKLMEYLVKLVSKEGGVILDPFGGSGTTMIACIKNNRNCIIIEKEPEYIELVKARIKPYLKQKKL